MRTCQRAGASRRIAEKVAREVESRIYDGISTDDVLELVIESLLKYEYSKGARYDLKRSILRLGPAGFGFEKFVARLLEEYGYRVETNVVVEGRCVKQEIDVIAENREGRYMIECKFHNLPLYTGLKEAMYTYARFLDVKDRENFTRPWMVTNTKFSEDAKKYGACMGIKLTGWSYPEENGIEQLLEYKNLYPITILRIDKETIDSAVNAGLVFCRDVLDASENELKRKGIKKAGELIEAARSFHRQ
nr:restriction endonuclease [Archaeoglobus neptunius]